ncbi:hypothetical protein ACSILG_000198 [Yersinia enterocolitica]|uniref:hypothetical protein n=1 Tax=Yersinia enterocolitica TaxID=630 RepID=UPI0005E736FD|nr:hypothetical protein [Yersinia enterocolitica]EKN4047462.1 hypothetical protein [Yersinia enterocolitica]CNG86604.1 Uncharacterised protein [Yersinia kristensenii]
MSIQLVLSHYLAGLRERNELDALLPELLKAMGHSVLSRPQIGPNQAGVDVLSTRHDANGVDEVYVFIIKFGNIGRADFYGGQQAIDPSVREACNDFLRNRLPEQLKPLRKKIVLVSNGELLQEAQAGFSALTADIAQRPMCVLEFWGTDQLTPWIEQYMFDETLLLARGKSDLSAALAGLEESGSATGRFIRFVDACFVMPAEESEQSIATRKSKFLRRCAAASMGWAVLLVWGKSEGNLKPGVVAGEYLLLRMWAEAVKLDLSVDRAFIERFEPLMELQIRALIEYFDKVLPTLSSPRAVLSYRPERIIYLELIFEEIGRLATLLLLIQQVPGQEECRTVIREAIIGLINQHSGVRLPPYDGHAIDLTLLFCALMGESDWNNTQILVGDVVDRLVLALKSDRYLPVDTDSLEDAIALDTQKAGKRDFFQTSTLIPALATVAAVLGDEETLRVLRDSVLPLMKGATLERWFPTSSLETFTGSAKGLQHVGISRALSGFRASSGKEAEASIKPFDGAATVTDFKWFGTQWQVLVALSARLHRHPLPTWFIGEYMRQHNAPQ